ncbi:CBS domain-containing protein [Candidatus Bathyarchaeota archaeon]|nr:CBS domain-containing protein [Candidatus Bathyarchaeota archaeon]
MDFPSTVGDAMSTPVIMVDSLNNVRDSAILMIEKGVGSIIVVEQGKPIGIVTKSDIIKRVVSLCLNPCETYIKDIMTQEVITIKKETGLLSAMRKMRELKISQLLVTEDDGLIGVISERDLLRAVSYASLAAFTPLMKS